MTAQPAPLTGSTNDLLIESYALLGENASSRRNRRAIARRFTRIYGGIAEWSRVPVDARLAESVVLRSYVAWAVVEHGCPVDVDYVVGTPTKWANLVHDREPLAHAEIVSMAADLGFNPLEIKRMWATLAKLSLISGTRAAAIADGTYTDTRAYYLAAVERRCGNVPKIFATPVFGLDSVMFHLHRGPSPRRRTRDGNRRPDWEALDLEVPVLAATMRRYLDQLAVSLRPGSVETIDTTMRMFVASSPTTTLRSPAPSTSAASTSKRSSRGSAPDPAARVEIG